MTERNNIHDSTHNHSKPTEKGSKIPESVSNAIGSFVVASLLALAGVVIALDHSFARHMGEYDGDRASYAILRAEFRDFKERGGRFTDRDGERLQSWVKAETSRLLMYSDKLEQKMVEVEKALHECRQRYVRLDTEFRFWLDHDEDHK